MSNYSNQVFINCPFDDEYLTMFRAIIFTVLDCGFIPRCSQEFSNATETRLKSIVTLIRKCKYGIHDISRVEHDRNTKLPRFNMPFELGLFHGAKVFGSGQIRSKACVILEKEKYRYQKFISDLAGIDIKSHNNSTQEVIFEVRNWLSTASKRRTVPDANKIFSRYKKFKKNFKTTCSDRSIDINNMPFIEFTKNISDWLKINQNIIEPLFH